MSALSLDERRRVLAQGDTRRYLLGVESALGALRTARVALAKARPAARSRLVDQVADLGLIDSVAPRGKLPRDFERQVARACRELLRRNGDGSWKASRRADPDLGRPANEVWPTSSPGTMPRVGAVIVSGSERIEIAERDASFEARVSQALEMLERAWPEGASIVRTRVEVVVPVREPGLVSFSSAALPGVVYVNVESRPVVRVAEDLLHEATHARIHEIEALHPLVDRRARGDGPETLDDGEGPRFWSPWRREWRPIRGLLHGACTFTVGARFFERMLAASVQAGPVKLADARRFWLARRLLEEMESVRVALRVLETAARRRWLLSAGRRLAAGVAREHDALRPSSRTARRLLLASPRGAQELATLRAHAERLRRRPVRWGWSGPS